MVGEVCGFGGAEGARVKRGAVGEVLLVCLFFCYGFV